jgi:DNA-directed RNA polymerase subunit H (RpoH/RPB5)
MTNSNYTLTIIYNNLYTYFNYKKLIPLDEKINDDDFIKHIYNNEYFTIPTITSNYNSDDIKEIRDNLDNINYKNEKNYKLTYILLFHYNSELYSKTQDLKKIINTFKKNPFKYEIMLITKNQISTHVKNYIDSIKTKLSIINYTYKLFTIIIPKHILSNKHEILSKEEEEKILNNVLFCKKSNLPKIKLSDPQIIWSSGKIGDIVCITRYDDISGLALYYRIIVK